jgi:hypothetical protein
MKYKTKQRRCIAITDAYRKVFNVTMIETTAVAEWAISQELWPVPNRGDPEDLCEEWERRLAQAERPTYEVGDKLRFAEEQKPYRIRAIGERYAVCTKPFKCTVLYTIVDFQVGIRGTENLVFGMGAETDAQCEEMLARIETGETEISERNRVPLKIVDAIFCAAQEKETIE